MCTGWRRRKRRERARRVGRRNNLKAELNFFLPLSLSLSLALSPTESFVRDIGRRTMAQWRCIKESRLVGETSIVSVFPLRARSLALFPSAFSVSLIFPLAYSPSPPLYLFTFFSAPSHPLFLHFCCILFFFAATALFCFNMYSIQLMLF